METARESMLELAPLRPTQLASQWFLPIVLPVASLHLAQSEPLYTPPPVIRLRPERQILPYCWKGLLHEHGHQIHSGPGIYSGVKNHGSEANDPGHKEDWRNVYFLRKITEGDDTDYR